MFNYRVTKQDTAMKMKPHQRKMLKKMLKGAKKGALPFDFSSGLTHTNLGSLWAPGMKLENVTGGGKKRSEERRVGQEGGRPCRSRWAPVHYKKKKQENKK